MHFLYVFILQFLYKSTCFQRPFRSLSGVHDFLYLQLCKNHANLSRHVCMVFTEHTERASCWFVYIFGYDARYQTKFAVTSSLYVIRNAQLKREYILRNFITTVTTLSS